MTDPAVIAPVTLAMLGAPPPRAEPAGGSKKVTMPYYDNLDE
jgi:hypothetical protein